MAQSGRRWQRSLFPWLIKWGFSQCTGDPCLFKFPDLAFVIGCYVDDLCIVHATNCSMYKRFLKDLNNTWDVEDEGTAVDLLNVQIEISPENIKLHQADYILAMANRYPAAPESSYFVGYSKLFVGPHQVTFMRAIKNCLTSLPEHLCYNSQPLSI